MDSNSDLNIEEDATLEIYVDGAIVLNSNTTINNDTHDPANLKIYGTDSMVDNGTTPAIQLNSNSDIYATVHAKNATVSLDSNVDIYGAVLSNKINMNSHACVHYDVALNSGGSATGADASVTLWQER